MACSKDVLSEHHRMAMWPRASRLLKQHLLCSETFYKKRKEPSLRGWNTPHEGHLPGLLPKAHPFSGQTLVSRKHSVAQTPLASCTPHAA